MERDAQPRDRCGDARLRGLWWPGDRAGRGGTWDFQVPNPGIAHGVDVHANGTYDFHTEGPGSPPSHSGTFAASSGHYTLVTTTLARNDEGTYRLTDEDTMVEPAGLARRRGTGCGSLRRTLQFRIRRGRLPRRRRRR